MPLACAAGHGHSGGVSGGAQRVGPYQLEGQLGSGSMGAVYRARHLELGVHHALKLLRPELARPGDQERFRREVELLARVAHPGLVRVHASDVERGRVWYSMDLVEGEDLERKLTKGPLEPRLAARLVRDVARAVQALHAQGVIHRDLKPANVVVDAQGLPRLVDMGLARAFTDQAQRLTLTGELVGTPYYMSPEQARGAPLGPYSDVWGLGMILYALLTGRPGVSGTSTAEVLEEVRAGRVIPLEKQVPGLPRGLVAVVRRALSPDPLERYPGAEELARALDGWLRTGAGDRRNVPLAVGLGVLALGSLSALAVTIVVVRGSDGPAGVAGAPAEVPVSVREATRAVEEARARLEALRGAFMSPGPVTAAELDQLETQRQALAVQRAGLPSPAGAAPGTVDLAGELVLLEGQLLIAQGELAVRAGDAARARACLGAVETLSDPRGGKALRELRRDGVAGLRGGLALISPDERDDRLALLSDLTRLSEAAPLRPDLRAWRIALALEARRLGDALAALEAAPDLSQLPADLRAETWIAAGKLELAEQLAPKLSRPVLSRLLWSMTLRALAAGNLGDAMGLAGEAMKAGPQDPLRADALKQADELLERARRWSRADPPEQLSHSLRAEIEASRLRAQLEPGWKLADARVVEVCQAFISAGPALGGSTVQLLADLIEVAGELGELYRLHAAAAVDWGLPDPRRDQALIRRGIERFRAEDPETALYLQEQLAKAMDDRQDLNGLLELARTLDAEATPRLRVTVLGRAASQLRNAGRLEESRQYLDQARQISSSAHELDLYEHLWARAMWERTRDPAHRALALEKAWTWLSGWSVDERSTWAHWLGSLCGWVCLEEEAAGNQDKALQALELLLRARDNEPRWAAHRLVVLARREPPPVAELQQGIAQLTGALDVLGDELAAAAEACLAEADKSRRLRELAAGYHGLTNTRHLEEAMAVDDWSRLRDGLGRLESRLSALDERRRAIR